MSFHFFSWITERGERSGVSLFLSLGLGGACIPSLWVFIAFLTWVGGMRDIAWVLMLTEQEFDDTES